MNRQLALNLRLRDGSSFENFHPGGGNREILTQLAQACAGALQAGARVTPLYLWGEAGTGKTHLLEAACRRAHDAGIAPVYISLRAASGGSTGISPAILDGLDSRLICLDDIEAVAGESGWERALFALWEAHVGALIISAAQPPRQLGLHLPDLVTRLSSAAVYQVRPLSDAEKIDAVRLRARNRGLELSADVARYLLNRYPRDMASMFRLLERIDAAAFAKQRRVTIPFLRELDNS